MTKTKSFRLTKNEYSKIVIISRFKKSWWLFALSLIVGLFFLRSFGKDNLSTFYTIFAFSYPLLTTVWLYFWAISRDHDDLFLETEMEFDDYSLILKRNGNESKVPIKNIKKIISDKNHWRLYLSKDQFLFIKKDVFFSQEDFHKFCSLIIDNNYL